MLYSMKKLIFILLVLIISLTLWATDVYEVAREGDVAKMKSLLQKDPKLLNAVDNRNSTALHFAAHRGHLELVKFLVSKGADQAIRDIDGDIPVCWAIQGDKLDVVKFLASKGANLKNVSNHKETMLHYAARWGSPAMVKWFLSKGLKPAIKNKFGQTPLFHAAGNKNFEIFKMLLTKDTDLKMVDVQGWNLLHEAAWQGSKETIEFLVKKGLSVESKTKDGRAPLLAAALMGNMDAIKALILLGADPNSRSDDNETPLYIAVRRSHDKIIPLLIKGGAKVNEKAGFFKRTPLHAAVIKGKGNVVSALLSNKPDLEISDSKGCTPVCYALKYGHHKIAEMLAEQGAVTPEKKGMCRKSLLKKELKEGTAIVFYLEHSGWAIKTARHLLIFDYFDNPRNRADEPGLANGYIDSSVLKGHDVIVFSSHSHADHYTPEIFKWKKDVKNIDYVIGFKPPVKDDYIYMAPRERKKVRGAEILTIESNDSGVGFVVWVDGLSIFHSGDHANRKRDFSGPFTKEIDFLAEKGVQPDLFFAPISGCGFGDIVAVKKGVYYTMKKLSPRSVFPMHAGDGGAIYAKFAKEAYENGFTIPMCCADFRGDVFAVTPEKIKGALKMKTECSHQEEKKTTCNKTKTRSCMPSS